MAGKVHSTEGNLGHEQKRTLTIGLGSALHGFAEADEVSGLIENLDSLAKTEKLQERLVEVLGSFF